MSGHWSASMTVVYHLAGGRTVTVAGPRWDQDVLARKDRAEDRVQLAFGDYSGERELRELKKLARARRRRTWLMLVEKDGPVWLVRSGQVLMIGVRTYLTCEGSPRQADPPVSAPLS